MRNCSPVSYEKIEKMSEPDLAELRPRLAEIRASSGRKVVVLDDDPTGIQTVHGVSVFTGWSVEELTAGFQEENTMFFVLTNSRAFTAEQTARVHAEIARNTAAAAKATCKDFIMVSRGDSTLRGHYPLETQTLMEILTAETGKHFDGEIIMPFFKEGGRLTIDDIHYVKEGDMLVPAGLTEFAADKTFGFASSDLKDWCEEKTGGKYSASNVISISLEDLRAQDFDKIVKQLLSAKNYAKIIVNAVDYCDAEVFSLAFFMALGRGKEFILRTAAGLPKVLGGVPHKPLLTHDELVDAQNKNGGIVLVGSHVKKTTMQLEELHNCRYPVEFIEFNQHLVLEDGGLAREVERVVDLAQRRIQLGKTIVVHTRRQRLDLDTQDEEKQLVMAVEISDAVTSIIGKLTVKPSFIIAKGGITSSDVGTKALRVKRATAMGQIRPGVPVWMTGEESKFPGMPYIIFPGNVGTADTLREAVEILMEGREEEEC
ncbi:MAG: four-carbon acid sugar kinase family protein [Angelakisella sp.]|nr:four-carbon acid sugar kinase family protein [Angelakisella sp.]